MSAVWDELSSQTEPRLLHEVPGPNARAVMERDARVTSPSLPRAYPLVPARGAGSMLEDVDGNVFLDFNAGIAVCSTGHAHPAVVEAVQRQADSLLHYSGTDFYLPVYSEVCERLDSFTPVGGAARSFLTNSGTEAVEAAIKLARHKTGRQYIVAFLGAFHGRSYGSVSLTASKSLYRATFGPLLPGVIHAPYANAFRPYKPGDGAYSLEDLDYLRDVVFARLAKPNEIAAIVLEPIQGEGGYVVPPAEWIRSIRELCDEHGILLVADEVQSGMGRTGRMWAMEQFDVVPDIVLSGKGVASGLPLGAMIAREDLMVWELGAHGSTYGGSPVSCAAALATFDVIEEEGLIDNAKVVGDVLLTGLRDIQSRHPIITDVRGRAFWIGMTFADHDQAAAIEQASFRKGLLILGCGDADIRVSPPLVFREDQAQAALELFEEVVAEVEAGA